jgi:hypothetical protein
MRSVRKNMVIELTYKSIDKEVTPLGRNGVSEAISGTDQVLRPGSHLSAFASARFPSRLYFAGSFGSVWCGATKFPHTEQTRADRAPAKIFDWKSIPGQDAYRRFFSKFTQVDNLRTADYFLRWLLQSYQYDNFTPDFDEAMRRQSMYRSMEIEANKNDEL